MNWRSTKLLERVRELPCQRCGAEDGTVCAAHSNQLRDDKGRGIKANDYRIAALCFRCHAEIDQGRVSTRADRREAWEAAHRSTIGALFERGIVKVV